MIPVVCALIAENGKLLVVQHGGMSRHPLKWEFPGGKVNRGEDRPAALIREIREELNIEIEIKESLEPVVFAFESKTIQLIPFLCIRKPGELMLNEHADYQWTILEVIFNIDLLPADRLMINTGDNFLRIANFTNHSQYQPAFIDNGFR